MKILSSFHLLAALGVLGCAGTALAQVDTSQWTCSSCPFPKGITGTVEAGAGDVTQASPKFGDWTGLQKRGGFAILGGDVSRRGDDGYYADFSASDLGLDDRRLAGRAGREGLYTLRLGYAEIPRHLTDGAATPFLGSGSNTLTLPGGFPAGDTASMPLGSALRPIDLGFKYRRLDIDATVYAGAPWSARLGWRHDEREGTRPTAGSFFSTASQFAAPVKEKTDQGELALAYATPRLQATLGYHVSMFRNDNASVTWANPFFPVVPGATTGQLALAPGNDFQQLRASGGYDLTPKIRISADAAFGRMTQDDAYLPATLNASLAPSVPALPTNNLGGRVDTFDGGAKVSAEAMPGLRLVGSYDRDRHRDRTPVRSYPIVTTDMLVEPGSRSNTPFGFTTDRFKLTADYAGQLPMHLRLSGGAQHERRERSYQEVVRTRETTIWAKASAQPRDNVTASLKLAHADRDHTTYGTSVWFGYAENPLLRKFYLADRQRDSAELRADVAFNEKVTLGFTADVANDNYNHSTIGLTSARSANLAAELSVAFSERTQARAYAQGQWIRSRQAGSQAFARPDWFGRMDDEVDVFGIGVRHVAIPNKLDLAADVTYTETRSDVSVDTAVGASPFPTALTRLETFALRGTWQLRKDVALVGSYAYEHFLSHDWHLEGVLPGTVPNLLSLGAQPPRYSVSVVRVALRYRF